MMSSPVLRVAARTAAAQDGRLILMRNLMSITGITLLGGEPFEPENQKELVPFMRKVVAQYPNKNVWAFTGYIYDKDLVAGGRRHTEDTDELLSMIDVLVDGPFVEELKDITLKFRGSSNQRVLDLRETIRTGKITTLF